MAEEPEDAEAGRLQVNEKKWTPTLMQAGFTILPNVLFERQQALGLTPLDINIILHIASYWWSEESRPHPSKTTIAQAIGIAPRTVQRRIASLEACNLIRREERRIFGGGSRTNIYHFDGLIEAAMPYALEKIEEIKIRTLVREAEAGRARRSSRRARGPRMLAAQRGAGRAPDTAARREGFRKLALPATEIFATAGVVPGIPPRDALGPPGRDGGNESGDEEN